MSGPDHPWHRRPRADPFVLPEDAERVTAFAPASDDFRLHLDLLPEPFLGSRDAPVVLPVVREVDDGHAAAPKLAFQRVAGAGCLGRPAGRPRAFDLQARLPASRDGDAG